MISYLMNIGPKQMADPCSLGIDSCQESTPRVAWSSLNLSVNVNFSFVENDR